MLCILKIFYKNPQYFTNCQCKFYSNHCVWFLLPQGQLPNPKIIIIAQQDLNYMSVILKCIVCIVCMKLSRGFIVRFFFSTVRMMKNIVPQKFHTIHTNLGYMYMALLHFSYFVFANISLGQIYKVVRKVFQNVH